MNRAVLRELGDGAQRYLQIDAFRAFALFGLFIVHCVELFELHWADPKPSLLFDTTFLVFAGKAFAMFALSFGISFSIIMERAEQRREPYEARFLWRLTILFGFGLAHTAIYRGDILVILALVGVLLVPLNRIRSNALLLILAAVFLINLPLLFRLGLTYAGVSTTIPIFSAANTASMQAYMSGGVLETIAANLGSGNLVKWLYMLESGRVSQVLGQFLLGLVFGRIGFFTQLERFQRHRRIITLVCGVLGLLLHHHHAALTNWFPPSSHGEVGFYISNLLGGWTNLLIMLFQTMMFFELWFLVNGRVLHYLAPVGRMSLTFYIGQSLVFVPLLYNFGFGLHDDLSVTQLLWIGIVGFIVQAIIAAHWIKYYHYGPLEWLWRVLTKQSFDVEMRRSTT